MAEQPQEPERHGGELAVATLRRYGVAEVFTLSGGHVFPLYDAAYTAGVPVYDVRHEQTAVFAAEAVAKLQRRPGVAVLTAGPGVTNAVSGLAGAWYNGAPVVALAGRAPGFRWGAGSLQEIDHVPLVAPATKQAATAPSTGQVPAVVDAAMQAALTPHRGPSFVDFPLEVVFDRAAAPVPEPEPVPVREPDPEEVAKAAALLAGAQRPVLVAGSDVYSGDAVPALREAAEALDVPVFTNGMGRGALPPEHRLAFGKCRRTALAGADVVAVVGAPLDFRLGFGDVGQAQLVHVTDAPEQRATHVTPAAAPAGDLRQVLSAFADHGGQRHPQWIDELRAAEREAAGRHADEMAADTEPLRPARVYGALRRVLDRDAVTIADGGDFASYAGRYLEPTVPGTWLDPGPYGCLGTGMGYAMGARRTYPDRQVCVLLGDGAAGFSLMDAESLVRQRLPVVMVVGNNGVWGLEKHPMRELYGHDVAADLQPGLRYDDVVRALGGAGETVTAPDALEPALRRAFDAGVPYLVNVLTDPADAYPRSSTLA